MRHRIAVIPGDGIGNEVVPEGQRVLEAAARRFGFELAWTEFDWSCERFKKTGRMMPEDGLEQLRGCDAIFLGAVGAPGVPDHVSLWGLLIPIRRTFRQYVNLRPVRLLKGVRSPLADRSPAEIDMVIVRENNEGEYSEIGGRLYTGTDDELAVQQAVFTRKGTDRVMRYAFELARKRSRRHVTSATKSNGIIHSMPYWDERFAAMAQQYPDVQTAQSPEKEHPSMFEPVHGSAPDIAGKGTANPIAQIWTGAMLLEHLGHAAAAHAVVRAIETVVADGKTVTRDLGGKATTREAGDAVSSLI
jgi:tartrate dehydrogenase/decarboxylase/D-malate dehydrogenase